MIVVDPSAVVAVLQAEPGWERLDDLLARSPGSVMSAAGYVELGIVVDRRGDPVLSRRLDALLSAWGVEVVDVTVQQAHAARAAYRDFGRGSGHPARLNYGDCFSYALATTTGRALLFVGDDFTHTDVTGAATPERDA